MHVLTQVTWKTGQSDSVIMSENIIKKCAESMKQTPTTQEGD